jgi:RNA polymerase sigma-70 factor (ECF subfamily)
MAGNTYATSGVVNLFDTHTIMTLPVNVEVEHARTLEARLVERARSGDVASFERIYRLHSGRVHGLCLRMLRDGAIAEDCVQETFITAWRHLHSFQARSTLATWLHRIAVNTVLARSRRKSLRNEPASFDEPPETAADAAEVMDLERVIGELPEGARHVLVLQGIYGYTHEEVAQMLGVAVGTCKAQLHRARKLLAERLAPNGKRER